MNIKLEDIKKIELDPNKKYLIVIDSTSNGWKVMKDLSTALKDAGFQAIVAGLNEIGKIKVIEQEKNENKS